MSFRISGLPSAPFEPFYGLSEESLRAHGVQRLVVDGPGFPDRIELRDAEVGESVLLLNYEHQSADTPYKSSHAIFVIEGARIPYDKINVVPDVMRSRMLSLRAFDAQHMMVDADLVDGPDVESLITRFFGEAKVAYIQAHYARRGCFAARIDRCPGAIA